ncbi:extracellular solute-binding protein [Rhizobium sp. CG5]|uniref:extracellular solute-binding protein n=1 Tax=Rhizobium sp. CG5 TaxID=2726076 RepID=UPI0020343879|nr:extracellular solute-binding protein [Rhizobium sp. CG5]MCM2477746.1 extracellular solute-binding protein [Rhizobium sp. CG5]
MKILSIALSALIACTALQAVPLRAQDAGPQIVKDPLELTIHFHFRDKYVYTENWPVEKKAAELTGIHVRNVASLATSSSRDAFNLLMASGELPDIVGGDVTGGLKDDFIRYGMEGAFLPLDELIAENAPNLKKFFDEHPVVRQAISAPDGHIYFIPYVPEGEFSRAWFIRQDWLDKLGLKTPQNVDELHDVLVAFRDKDPNGNGKKDEVPYFAREPIEAVRLINMWDARVSGSERYGDFNVVDGKIEHPWTTENYRTGITNLAKWFKEGLIDKEVFTRGARVREYMLGNNLGGMTHDWFASTSNYTDALKASVPGINFRPMLPPKTVSGKRFEDSRRATVQPAGWAMSYSNKHPVETIKYFDFWFSEQGKILSNWGVEGETYDMINGKPVFKDSVLHNPKPVNAQMWEIGAGVPRGYVASYESETQWTNKMALDGIAMYQKESLLLPEFTGVSMTEQERGIYDKYWPGLFTYMTEMQQTWVLGAQDPNTGWDAYQARLKQMNYPEVAKVMQDAYDRQYDKK